MLDKFKTRSKRDKTAEDQRLSLLAKELSAAMLVVLINDCGYSKSQANDILGKVLAQAKTNRMIIATNAVVTAYDVLNKEESNG